MYMYIKASVYDFMSFNRQTFILLNMIETFWNYFAARMNKTGHCELDC